MTQILRPPGTYSGHVHRIRHRPTDEKPAITGPFQADDGARTRDLRLGKPTLYQLSYVRVVGDFRWCPGEPRPTVAQRPGIVCS